MLKAHWFTELGPQKGGQQLDLSLSEENSVRDVSSWSTSMSISIPLYHNNTVGPAELFLYLCHPSTTMLSVLKMSLYVFVRVYTIWAEIKNTIFFNIFI